jgi:hypothetical protein
MADSYLSIAAIASDEPMTERMNAATTQQQYLGSFDAGYSNTAAPFSAQAWVKDYRYVWASSPGWGAAWDSALAAHPDDPDYEPGKDPAVITDGMILSTVQQLGGTPAGAQAEQAEPEPEPKRTRRRS